MLLLRFRNKQCLELDIRITESFELADRNGENREIDILLEASVCQSKIRIAVECRDHKRPQTKEWIDALIGKYRDLEIQKIIAVSKSGFTAGALKHAKTANIETMSPAECQAVDWSEKLITVGLATVSTSPSLELRLEVDPKPTQSYHMPDSMKIFVLSKNCSYRFGEVRDVIVRDIVSPACKLHFQNQLQKAKTLAELIGLLERIEPAESTVHLENHSFELNGITHMLKSLHFKVSYSSKLETIPVSHNSYSGRSVVSEASVFQQKFALIQSLKND